MYTFHICTYSNIGYSHVYNFLSSPFFVASERGNNTNAGRLIVVFLFDKNAWI